MGRRFAIVGVHGRVQGSGFRVHHSEAVNLSVLQRNFWFSKGFNFLYGMVGNGEPEDETMDQRDLFGRGTRGDRAGEAPPPRIGPKRLRHAVRNQIEFQECSLDELLSEDHEARIAWAYVCGLDLSELTSGFKQSRGARGKLPPTRGS